MNEKSNPFIFAAAGLLVAGIMSFQMNFKMKEAGKERIQIIQVPKENRVDVTIDGQPFTSYIYPTVIKKPVLNPLRTAAGTIITRGYPLKPIPGERVDHPHHIGMWFNFGDVNGDDFWNNSDQIQNNPDHKGSAFGTIKHKAVKSTKNGNNQGELEVTADWVSSAGKNILLEETKFIFTGDESKRTIERITTLIALNKDVLFKDNKEGMLGIRVARALEQPSDKPDIFTDDSGRPTSVAKMNNEGVNGKYRTNEKKEGDEVWGTKAKWCNLSSKIGNEALSLAIIDHPENPGYPTYWHARGYGLFAANPLGKKVFTNGQEEMNFTIPSGKSATFRHRIVIHSGSILSDEQLNTEADQFAGKK